MKKGFSVVVCSYNPECTILERLVTAIAKLNAPVSLPVEYIFIDNNSSTPISSHPALATFLAKEANSKCITEEQAGLTEARTRGFREAVYEWIVFFDDDNEPEKNYLVNLEKTIGINPEVVCWGPADINVEFLTVDKNNDWLLSKKFYFQERSWGKTEFGVNDTWQYYFPYGTGLVVHCSVMQEYTDRIQNGQYSLSDRKGKSLSSGGDLQIVLTATNMGLPVGTIKGLSVNHLIAPKKSRVSYLERQVYGTSSSYVAAHKQVNQTSAIDEHLATNAEMFKKIITIIRIHLFKERFNDFRLSLAGYFGGVNARFVYLNVEKKPFLLRTYERIINA